MGGEMRDVWYVAYGSNLSRARFLCYIVGGRPVGGSRTYPGCRDATLPTADVGVELDGRLYFAGLSRVWGGGMAFFDPDGTDRVAARAYLLTGAQFVDVVEQEMWRDPTAGSTIRPDLAELATATRHTYGPGHYETLAKVGEFEGYPMITFTRAEHAPTDLRAPSPAYLETIATGLREAHGWDDDRVQGYLRRFVVTAEPGSPAVTAPPRPR